MLKITAWGGIFDQIWVDKTGFFRFFAVTLEYCGNRLGITLGPERPTFFLILGVFMAGMGAIFNFYLQKWADFTVCGGKFGSDAQTMSTILQSYCEQPEKSSFIHPNLAKFATSSRDFSHFVNLKPVYPTITSIISRQERAKCRPFWSRTNS